MQNNAADIDVKKQILPDQLKILFSNILPNTFGSVMVMIIYLWAFNDAFVSNFQYYWAGVLLMCLAGRVYIYKLSRTANFFDNSKRVAYCLYHRYIFYWPYMRFCNIGAH